MEIEVLASSSKGNCYKINTGNSTILLECGLPIKLIQKKLNYKLSNVAACLITHEHMDHAKAVKDMLKAGIDCYMTKGTAKALGAKGHRLHFFEKKNEEEYKVTNLEDISILPFAAVHDVEEPVSFYIKNKKTGESLVFITDTAYIKYKIPKIDILMIECNYTKKRIDENVENGSLNPTLRNRIIKNHLSLETLLEVLQLADLSKCKKIYLIHLSDSNSDMFEIKRRVQEATGCEVWI